MFGHKELERITEGFVGKLGLYIKYLDTEEVFQHEADVPFPAASVIKLPLLIEVFRRVDTGKLHWKNRYRLFNSYSKIFATGSFRHFKYEPEISLRDYVWFMIATSDDVATDFLFDLVGFQPVNDLLESMNCFNTRANFSLGDWHYNMAGMTGMPKTEQNDQIAREKLLANEEDPVSIAWSMSLDNNVASARDMGILLEALYRNQAAKVSACEQMVTILKQSLNRSMIPRFISPSIEVAHKYGGSRGIKNDVGIVYFSSSPVIVSAFTLDLEGQGKGSDIIAGISREIARDVQPGSLVS